MRILYEENPLILAAIGVIAYFFVVVIVGSLSGYKLSDDGTGIYKVENKVKV